jgi:hypothetical protein
MRPKFKRQMNSYQDRSWKILIKPLGQEAQSLKSTGRGADGHDVAISHDYLRRKLCTDRSNSNPLSPLLSRGLQNM